MHTHLLVFLKLAFFAKKPLQFFTAYFKKFGTEKFAKICYRDVRSR